MRFAYLITAYTDINLLEKLVNNINLQNQYGAKVDIYIIWDKNSPKLDRERFSMKNVEIFDDIPTYWGSENYIIAIINALQKIYSTDKKYDYYHLISGNDFVIKSPEHIVNFFKQNYNLEFIDYVIFKKSSEQGIQYWKANYYHFFVNNRFYRKNKFLKFLNHLSIKIQKIMKITRNRANLYNGSVYFSVTEKLVKLILENKNTILKNYRYTLAGDEVWLQSFYMDLKNKNTEINKLYRNSLRYIDWERGNPYTFVDKDYQILMSLPNDMLFARKFNEKDSWDLIEKIERSNNHGI